MAWHPDRERRETGGSEKRDGTISCARHPDGERASPHFNELIRREAPIGHDKDILLAHAPDHLERIRSLAPEEGFEYLDPDTAMSPGSFEAAFHAVGAATAAVDMVFAGEAENAF